MGRAKAAKKFADMLEVDLAIMHKGRPKHNHAEITALIGDVDGKTCILNDDMIDTGGSVVGWVEKSVVLYCYFVARIELPVIVGQVADGTCALLCCKYLIGDASVVACDSYYLTAVFQYQCICAVGIHLYWGESTV